MKIDELVSLKKKTKLAESEILTEKDYVGGAPQKQYFTFARDPEKTQPRSARAKPPPETLKPTGIGKSIGTLPLFKGKGKGRKTPPVKKPIINKPKIKQLKTKTKFLPPKQPRLKDPFARLKLPPTVPIKNPPGITIKQPTVLPKPQLKIPPGPQALPKLPAPNKLALPKPGLKKPELLNKPFDLKQLHDKPAGQLTSKKDAKVLTNLQKKALDNARKNLKLDQKQVKTLTGKLKNLLDKPNLNQWKAINDQIPLVKNKTKRAMLKKELLRIQNLHYSGSKYFQKTPIPVSVGPEKELSTSTSNIKPSKPKLDHAMTPKPGEGIKTFAKRMGFASVVDLEMAQKNLNGGKIGTDLKTGNKYVLKGAKYVDAKTWKASTQFRRLEILSKLKTVKQGGNAYKKLISQLDDIKASEKGLKSNKLKAGAIVEPETTKTDTRKVVQIKGKIEKGDRKLTDPNTRYVDGRYKVPRFVQSVGGAIKFAGLGAGVAFLWAGTDALAQAEFVNKTTKEQDALPDDLSPLKILSPYQYYGGIGGAPVESMPFNNKATNITQTLGHGQSKKRREMLEDSFTNMKLKDVKDFEYSDEFVTNNHVSVMGPDGVPQIITPRQGKRVWDLYNQPGTVIQIIPKFDVVAGKQMKISRDQIGQGVTTFVMSGERTTPSGVYHDVSPEEKEGGTKLNPDGTPMTIDIYDEVIDKTITKNMYIPLRMELDHYKRIGEMPPADWYITDEDKEDIESGKKGQETMQTVADYALVPGITAIAGAGERLPGSLIPGHGLIVAGTRLWNWFTGEDASEDAPEELITAGTNIWDTITGGEDKKIEAKIVTYVNSWKGKAGAPDTTEDYNKLIDALAIEHDLDPALLKALGMTESTIQIQKDGTLNKWEPRGDRNLGIAGAFGIFHVRSDPDKKASVEQYNQDMGTTFTWEDIASNPRLSATIGAWYFKSLLDYHQGDEYRAYADYTGGQGAFFSTNIAKRNEVRVNANRFSKNLDKIYDSGLAARPKESKNYIENNIITEKGNKRIKDNDIFDNLSLSP
jgi:hypothetical protein